MRPRRSLWAAPFFFTIAIMAPEPNRSRNVYVFGLTSFLNDTASEMAYWVLPAFLTTLGAGPGQLGLIEGIAESIAASAKFFSGVLADRFPRRKPLVIAGYAIANLAKPLLALTNSWVQVLGIRFADRLAKGVRSAPRDVMLAESVPRERMGAAFGLLQSMDTAGAIVGPLLALLLIGSLGFSLRTLFWLTAIPGLLSVAIVTLGAKETSISGTIPAGPRAQNAGNALPGRFYYFLGIIGLFSLGNSSDMFLVLRAQEVGIPVAAAPLLGLVFNVVQTAGAWPAGRLSDRWPKRWLVAAGYAIFALTYLVFGAAPSALAIWAAMAVYGAYYALTVPALKALVIETVPAQSRGRALGLFYFVTSITALLASLLTGMLWDRFGGGLPFRVSAGLALVAAGLLLVPVHSALSPE